MGKYCVYLITNLLNGKMYCGQTCHKIERRWRGHLYDSKRDNTNRRFYNAIKKYGPESFSVEVLESGLTKEGADYKETAIIAGLNLTDPEVGYNLTEGGEGGIPSEETKKKMKANNTSRHWDVADEEVKLLYLSGLGITEISNKVRLTAGAVWWRLKQMGVSMRAVGHDLPTDKLIERYQNGETFGEIAKDFNVNEETIRRRINEAGVESRPKGVDLIKNLPMEEVIEMYKNGESLTQIAKHFSVSTPLVSGKLIDSGVPLRSLSEAVKLMCTYRKRPTPKPLPEKEIIQMYNDGMSFGQIGRKYKLSGNQISTRLVGLGVHQKGKKRKKEGSLAA